MSNENYKLLSDKLDAFKKDLDNRLDAIAEKMVTKGIRVWVC